MPARAGGAPKDGVLRRGAFEFSYVDWKAERARVRPDILLLHGLSSNARYWDRVARELPDRRVVALDLTPSEAADAAMNELIADVALAIRELGLERPVLAGHSWGAGLGLEFVVAHPELVSGFVFVDGPLTGVARMLTWEEVEAMMQPPFPHYATEGEAVAEARAGLGGAWGEDLTPYVTAGLRRDEGGLVARLTPAVRLQILRDLHGSDAESLWRRVRVPAVALIAQKSDARISRSTEAGMARMGEIAPAVPLKRFATPHDIPLYAPAGVAEEIELVATAAGAAPAASA